MNTAENEAPMTTNTPPSAPTFTDECNRVRAACKGLEMDLRAMKDKIANDRRGKEDSFPGQTSEVLGQITLAFRHLEDARMRVGKTIQYSGDGVSVFDK